MFKLIFHFVILLVIFDLSSSLVHRVADDAQRQQICKVDYASDAVLDKYFQCTNQDHDMHQKIMDESKKAQQLCMDKMMALLSNYTMVKKELGKRAIVYSCFTKEHLNCLDSNMPLYTKYSEYVDNNKDKIKACHADAIKVNNNNG